MDRALHIIPKSAALSGFNYNRDLLKASMANTYIETVGNRADSIHLAVKAVNPPDIYWAYLGALQPILPRTGFTEHDAVLAFDHTDEEFMLELVRPFFSSIRLALINAGWESAKSV